MQDILITVASCLMIISLRILCKQNIPILATNEELQRFTKSQKITYNISSIMTYVSVAIFTACILIW